MALHRPSLLIPHTSSAFVTVLRSAAEISVDLYWHYFQQQQVTINWQHLYQVFASCTSLLYCFSECKNRPDLAAISDLEILAKTERFNAIIRQFDESWAQTIRFQAVLAFLTSTLASADNAHPDSLSFSSRFDAEEQTTILNLFDGGGLDETAIEYFPPVDMTSTSQDYWSTDFRSEPVIPNFDVWGWQGDVA